MPLGKIVLTVAVAFGCGVCLAQTPALRLEREIPLPGVEGRIDHLSADLDSQRVFVAALGNGTVEVVDLRQGQRVGEIKWLKEPQGLLYLPSNHTLYVATGGDGMVRSYDGRTLALFNSISVGDDADNLRYDLQRDRVLVGYGSGAIASLFRDLTGKVEVRLPAHPESFQFSADGAHLFVNLPRDQSIALVDLPKLTVTEKWEHLGAQANFPMAAAPGSDRIFVACRQPAQLLALNTKIGKVTERIETVGDADDLFFDQERGRIYVIGGEGFVDVVTVPESGKLSSIGHVPTAESARTGLFVPGWSKLLVAAPHRGAAPARLLVYALRDSAQHH
jgi:DNA-binding beta-propeller fold protein YncE